MRTILAASAVIFCGCVFSTQVSAQQPTYGSTYAPQPAPAAGGLQQRAAVPHSLRSFNGKFEGYASSSVGDTWCLMFEFTENANGALVEANTYWRDGNGYWQQADNFPSSTYGTLNGGSLSATVGVDMGLMNRSELRNVASCSDDYTKLCGTIYSSKRRESIPVRLAPVQNLSQTCPR